MPSPVGEGRVQPAKTKNGKSEKMDQATASCFTERQRAGVLGTATLGVS